MKMISKAQCLSRFWCTIVLFTITIVIMSCSNDDALDGSLDNKILIEQVIKSGGSLSEFIGGYKFLTCDEEIECTKGNVFFVRMEIDSDTVYTFWAMEKYSDSIIVWPFGGVIWGKAGDNYLRKKSNDSLRYITGQSEWWNSDDMWKVFKNDKDAMGAHVRKLY